MGQFIRHVFVCTHGEYCPADGGLRVYQALKDGVRDRGLKKTVRVNKSGCLDQCGNGPMVVVYPDDIWYAGVTLETAARILDEHLVGGRPVAALVYAAPPGPNRNPLRIAAIDKAAGSKGSETPQGS
jgi:(2Fe-2S) ferredoxin